MTTITNKIRFLFIILQWKLKDTFHWHTYISCRLSPIHYYSFFHRFENFVFVLSSRTDPLHYWSSFSFGPARSVGKITSHLPAKPVGKMISHLPTDLGSLTVLNAHTYTTTAKSMIFVFRGPQNVWIHQNLPKIWPPKQCFLYHMCVRESNRNTKICFCKCLHMYH